MTCYPCPRQPDCDRKPARADYRAIVKLILCAITAIGWTHSAVAQIQGPQPGDQSQSAAELGKQASNPLVRRLAAADSAEQASETILFLAKKFAAM